MDKQETKYDDTWTIEQLEYALEAAHSWIAHHLESVRLQRQKINAVQAELDRRALAAYFDSHPELERVAVGDKLLVTEEAYESKHRFNYRIGETITISRIDAFLERIQVNIECDTGVWLFDDNEIIDGMRRAYLQQHPEETQ